MSASLKSAVRWLQVGWFWVAVVLVLPNCTLNRHGLASPTPPTNLAPGPLPHSSAIFCDIELPAGRQCASTLTAAQLASAIRLAEAAVALNTGRTSAIGLDESPEARARCGGEPEAVFFEGAFPEGRPSCVNCGAVLTAASDALAACRAACYDIYGSTLADRSMAPDVPPTAEVQAFCDSQARPATNQPLNSCFEGACVVGGTLAADFVDPRRTPEPVAWGDFIGTEASGPSGASLTRNSVSGGSYDAGAVSTQWITHGDAYVEFSAAGADESHFIGLTAIPAACAFPCTDTDPSFTGIGFAVMLHFDGRFYVSEGGTGIAGPDFNGSYGTYAAGDRFRVSLRDNSDGSATVTYSRIVGPCTPGMPCNETVFLTHTGTAPQYPFRVDASIREQGATVTDARLMRIQ